MSLGKIFAVVCFVLISKTVFAASFDCAKASPGLEKTVCTDALINKADEEMANYYFKLLSSLDAEHSKVLLSEQRAWLKQRTKQCVAGDLLCLRKIYNDRIHALRIKYENLVPFSFPDSGSFQGLRGTCGFPDINLPSEFVIYATGWYSGRKLDIQIDQSGNEAGRFDIAVNSPEKPVVLILGAYDPSIWNIGWTKGTKILAVVATGYHRQTVAGLPKETPILISTYDNGGLCGHLYLANGKQGEVDVFSKKLFKKPADMIYLAGGGKAVVGGPIRPSEQLFTSSDVTVDSLIDRTRPLAGLPGLKDAVVKGVLRLATKEDREEWIKRKVVNAPKDDSQPKPDLVAQGVRPIETDQAYVILKPFQIPAGLSGGNLAVFYLPKGTPFPKGDLGHSVLYDFNTMICHGILCNP